MVHFIWIFTSRKDINLNTNKSGNLELNGKKRYCTPFFEMVCLPFWKLNLHLSQYPPLMIETLLSIGKPLRGKKVINHYLKAKYPDKASVIASRKTNNLLPQNNMKRQNITDQQHLGLTIRDKKISYCKPTLKQS